ncbi:hypothetical protein GSY74_00820 [Sulfurovum sp. bin170]|uniref:ParB N-terminal domain-containing protein n=1 Tax=Sulfurovum sp. bin170 TaxID=2695268 RepID=UPI0013DED7D1|nr:ParB N-terminal domain-containing protein [Sulfurovum sp. bin170]NEW59810.1 hypothetical protein [Sulfurovum sp. bin170]
MNTTKIKLENLFFDPDNLRYDDNFDFDPIPKNSIMNKTNQLKVYNKLQNDISELKGSIIANDFIYIEMIVAEKIDNKGNYYIIEGNRRLCTLKHIAENYHIDDLKPSLQKIIRDGLDVKVNSADYDEDVLMGMRHITGVKHWNGFAKAKLVIKLKDIKDYSFEEIGQKVGKRVADVKKQYYSFKLLYNMQQDGYNQFEVRNLYTIFYETLGKPSFRDWLEWDENRMAFLNKNNLDRFYRWITKSADAEGALEKEAISSPQALREVSRILDDDYALDILDATKNPFEAVSNSKILKEQKIEKTLKKILDSVESISTTDLEKLDKNSIRYLGKIEKKVQRDIRYLKFLNEN